MDFKSYRRRLKNADIDRKIHHIQTTDMWKDLNPLELRYRFFLKRFRLKEQAKTGSPAWSKSRSLFRALSFAGFDMIELEKLFQSGAFNNQIKQDIRRMIKLNIPCLTESGDWKYSITEILTETTQPYQPKVMSQEETRRALSFSLWNPDWTPLFLLCKMLQPLCPIDVQRFILFALVGVLSHYFPVRGSSILAITCSDVSDMDLSRECAVLHFRNVKLKRKPLVWKGIPRWYGILLRLYLRKVRVSVADSDLLFVDPISGVPLGKMYRVIGPYLKKEYYQFRSAQCEEYIGGNLKRKMFSTVINHARSDFAELSMEHSEKTAIRHYAQKGRSQAITTFTSFVSKYESHCEMERAKVPFEWISMIDLDENEFRAAFDRYPIEDLDLQNVLN
jgi:hypothetical protein